MNTDLSAVLKTRQGQRVLWHILGLCGVYNNNFSPERSTLEYLEGRRSIGIELLQAIEAVDPLAYANMIIKNEREKTNDRTN